MTWFLIVHVAALALCAALVIDWYRQRQARRANVLRRLGLPDGAA